MKILLTAFEPYEQWPENASWLTLVRMLQERPPYAGLITRRYPVDWDETRRRLYADLASGFDVVLHLGQCPGAAEIRLEALAVNAAGRPGQDTWDLPSLVPGGPEAYRSRLPLERWQKLLTQHDLPSAVSYHAGTFLCNAALYWSHHWLAERGTPGRVGFVHLPLTTQQRLGATESLPCMPLELLVRAVSVILDDLIEHVPAGELVQAANKPS